jgi:hypothetical protein
MGSTTHLSALPPELLNHICDYLPRQGLSRLSQCSRRLYELAIPRLVRRVDLLSTIDEATHRPRDPEVLSHFEALAIALLRKPELGAQVRHLAIRLLIPGFVRRTADPLDVEVENALSKLAGGEIPWSWLFAVASKFKPAWRPGITIDSQEDGWSTVDESSDDDDWEPEIDGNDPEHPQLSPDSSQWVTTAAPWVRESLNFTLLPICTPKLQSLDISVPPEAFRYLDEVICHAPQTSPPLAGLERFCYGGSSRFRRVDLWDGLFSLTHVKAIYMHFVKGGEATRQLQTPQSHDVTHLEMRDCVIWPSALKHILCLPKALKTFIYVIGEQRTNYIARAPPISYRSVWRALESQKDSLEQIWIDYPHDYEFDEMSTRQTLPMGSFASFKKLRRLRIASTYVFGFVWTDNMDTGRLVRALPEQIEMLHLTHADEVSATPLSLWFIFYFAHSRDNLLDIKVLTFAEPQDEETIEGVHLLLEAKQHGRFEKLRELRLDVSITWILLNGKPLWDLLVFAKEVGLEMGLFNNHSDSRVEKRSEWIKAAALGFPRDNRTESRWGFDGEVEWPERITGCMKKPEYEKVRITDNGWVHGRQQSLLLVTGDAPAPAGPQ